MDFIQKNSARQNVGMMFDRISRRYDFLNRLLSLRQDVRWRRRMSALLPDKNNLDILDLAAGTADVLVMLSRQNDKIRLGVGMDMATRMLAIGRRKISRLKSASILKLLPGDAAHLPFHNDRFDAVTIAFGIRNFTDVDQALDEIYTVLKANGRLIVLEFSLPTNGAFKSFYLFYFRNILPFIGSVISGDPAAYRYLNRSVEAFPYGTAFCDLLKRHGFADITSHPLTFGIATIYLGHKR